MNIKETIRAEIERRIEINKTKGGFPAGTYCAIRIDAYKRLLKYIGTIPDNSLEGLDAELERYWNWVTGFQPSFAVLELTKEKLAKVARHFAEWGAEHAKTPTP